MSTNTISRAARARRGLRASDLCGLLASGVSSTRRTMRVRLVSTAKALDAPGGGEIQMLSLCRALCDLGVDAEITQSDAINLAEIDVVHLFGSSPEHLPLVRAAKQQRKPVVLSSIAWFDLTSRWREAGPLSGKLLGCAGHLARRCVPRLPSWRRRLYTSVARILPNSQAESAQLQKHFALPKAMITAIPNAADLRFATARPERFVETYGVRDFVLCAGRIEPRKNQLGLLTALRGSGVPVVIVGDGVPGYEWYTRQVIRAADEQVRFIPRIEHDDPLLASCFAASRCLVLPSWFETPGLVALEAGMSGTPLVLTNRGCAKEYFGWQAEYIGPGDHSGIRHAVLNALTQPRRERLARHVQTQYSWRRAALATLEVYRDVA